MAMLGTFPKGVQLFESSPTFDPFLLYILFSGCETNAPIFIFFLQNILQLRIAMYKNAWEPLKKKVHFSSIQKMQDEEIQTKFCL